MVVPSRAGRDCSLQLIKPLIFSILQAHVRKLLLPETLTRKCHKWLWISELTLMPTVMRWVSFQAHHLFKNSIPSLAFAEGQAERILGMISRAGGHPLVKWLPLCLPPSTFYLLTEANCKQELIVVWSGVVMIPTLSRAPDSPPLPIHFASSNGFQMFPCWPEPPLTPKVQLDEKSSACLGCFNAAPQSRLVFLKVANYWSFF